MRLANKIAVVTGGASGIGRSTVTRFAEEGAAVVAVDIDAAGASEVARHVTAQGGRAIGVAGDVSDEASVREFVSAAVEEFGGFDIFVSNAGIQAIGDVTQVSVEAWDRLFAVNVRGAYLCARSAVPVLRARGGGALLFTASTAGYDGFMGQGAYAATKAAVASLTKSIALDHAHENIRSNCVCPGPIRTPISTGTIKQMGPEVLEHIDEIMKLLIPLGAKMGEPEDIANAFVYLASDEARFVTGHDLFVDGGNRAGQFFPMLV